MPAGKNMEDNFGTKRPQGLEMKRIKVKEENGVCHSECSTHAVSERIECLVCVLFYHSTLGER